MRPFGEAMDLDVDFGAADRPGLVTTVLSQCAGQGDPAFWWGQPVGERTTALLQVVTLTVQSDALPLTARCVANGCGESFEFELPWRTLPAGAPDAGPLHVHLADALAAADPLVHFTVACRCPACGAPNEVDVDLETIALATLLARQRTLLHDVHMLASNYGWTEPEVLAVPPARRARYIALIEDGR